jgi:hypothetical protein
VDGIEFISIMFEMKNEMDTTATKKRNEDFLKELDKDRNVKKCELLFSYPCLRGIASLQLQALLIYHISIPKCM